ncbi:hypothetical protein HB815_00105 [Listeria booriae]|uniref:Uncharacterized protein n=1 Tax=Listeria booriae TaxID=1552123 RepID=A0A7X1CN72_9LIST|nr:hypothetical protein [Listeria booriae]MBC1209315.1 hypothetical protein [Listeria booriae]MBC1316098.1 hypothetical protein [Listeria booriae]MBC1795043.1 hypothetical protein [Listeria booriae]
MSLSKRALSCLLIVTFILVGVFSLSSTEAFAMGSKGSSNLKFQTDANNYSKNATSIVVTGFSPNSNGVLVMLYKKGNNTPIKQIETFNYGNYKVSFLLKGLSAGKYDIHVDTYWGPQRYHSELTNYLNVAR